MSWMFRAVPVVLVISVMAAAPAMGTDGVKPPRIDQLEERFVEPDTFQWGRFTNGDGADIRYGWIEPAGELRAVAVLLPGRGALIEQYFEVIRDLQVRGFAIWAMDWRGQGGSERYLDNPQKSHSLGFERDVADLRQFVTTIVQRRGKPLFLFVGSFAAHVSLRYLHDHPDGFDFAVIISPMLGINTDPLPSWTARWLAWLATAFGFGETYVLGGGDWQPDAEHLNDMVKGSSDPLRCCINYTYFRERPEFRSGSATYRWLDVAFGSMAMINETDYLKAIGAPVLMASSLADQTVIPAASERACSLMPNCRFRPVKDARHSLLFERDELRNQVFEEFDQFTTEMLIHR